LLSVIANGEENAAHGKDEACFVNVNEGKEEYYCQEDAHCIISHHTVSINGPSILSWILSSLGRTIFPGFSLFFWVGWFLGMVLSPGRLWSATVCPNATAEQPR
jgi:hypothetical protein